MKKKLILIMILAGLLRVTAPTLYSQDDPPEPPQVCEHISLERMKGWVPSAYQELFSQFILFQNLENVGFNFCTLAEARARLKALQEQPDQHKNELKYLTIWVEVLDVWVQEEELHWKETLPKFLPPEEVEKTLKKLEHWKQHCNTCVQKLAPPQQNVCRAKGLYHRHAPAQKH